tara:strand:+ start:342 stop:575 length:234 start_codon:yes stop_codon:yes gene_type:complete
MILMIDEFFVLIAYANLLLFKKLVFSEFASVFIKDFLLFVLLFKVLMIDDFNDCFYLIDDSELKALQYYVIKGSALT